MKTSNKRVETAFQRHVDFAKYFGIFFLIVALLDAYYIYKFVLFEDLGGLAGNQLFFRLFSLYVFCISILLGIGFCIRGSIEQNKIDGVNAGLYAVWKYKPQTIYRFERKMCRYKKKTESLSALFAAVIIFIIGLFMFFDEYGHYVGIAFFFFAATVFIYALLLLPYSKYLLLKLNTTVWGDAKEIIFSRGGIWYCGTLYNFSDRKITYHRVERQDLHGFDVITFYFTLTRGFQQKAFEVYIPVSPKMAYAADELVEFFNKSDLLDDRKDKSIFDKS